MTISYRVFWNGTDTPGGARDLAEAFLRILGASHGFTEVEAGSDSDLAFLFHSDRSALLQEIFDPVFNRETGAAIPVVLTDDSVQFRGSGVSLSFDFIVPLGPDLLTQIGAHAAQLRGLAVFWMGRFDPTVRPAILRETVRDAFIGRFLQDLGVQEDSHHQASIDFRAALPAATNSFGFVWPNAFQALDQFLTSEIGNSLDESSLRKALHAKLPRRTGVAWATQVAVAPKILVIDDEAYAVVDKLEQSAVSTEEDLVFRDLCRFYPAPLLESAPSFEAIRESLVAYLNRSPEELAIRFCALPDVRTANFVLLDLSMKQEPSAELGGLDVLRVLKSKCPDVPVVIHSAFGDYRNVIQAVQNGAAWFFQKDAPTSLLAVFEDLSRRHHWGRERDRIKREIRYESDAEPPTNIPVEECEYLWSKLASALPDGPLTVRRLGGGISGAITRKVTVNLSALEFATSGIALEVAPFVAKIDRTDKMLSEKERFRRLIQPHIGNRAGRVDAEPSSTGTRSAIAYAFTGGRQGAAHAHALDTAPLEVVLRRNLSIPEARFVAV